VPIVRGCQGAGHEDLRASIVTQVFPTVVQRVLSSDDSAILQVEQIQCHFILHFRTLLFDRMVVSVSEHLLPQQWSSWQSGKIMLPQWWSYDHHVTPYCSGGIILVVMDCSM
jgi:hypothetical protein